MTPGFQSFIRDAAEGQVTSFKEISEFSPSDIREGIQLLVTEDRMDLAQALADAGISLHPDNEEILAIAGLLALTRFDWPLGIELLTDLCALQKDMVQPMTYQMLGRALWCNLDLSEARAMITRGLTAYPGNASLLAEQREMSLAENVMPASFTSN
jgi:uncharacterized protein HemY